MKKKIFFIGIILLLAFIAGCSKSENNSTIAEHTHKHAGVKVYVLGNAIDFGLPQYQLKSREVHFENGNSDIAHIHAPGITLGHLFKTLGMEIEDACLKLSNAKKYCNDGNIMLRAFVNGKNDDWEKISYAPDYVMQDFDRILITLGNESEIKMQMQSVIGKAAMRGND